MNSPFRALAIRKLKRSLSRTAKKRLKAHSEKEQNSFITIMEKGPEYLELVINFLEDGLTDVNLLYNAVVKYENVDKIDKEIVEEIVYDDKIETPVLASTILKSLDEGPASQKDAKDIIKLVSNNKDMGVAQEIELAQEISKCKNSEDLEKAKSKISNPRKHLDRYQKRIDEAKNAKEKAQISKT